MDCASRANVTRFETYCRRREKEALAATLSGFYTIKDASAGYGLVRLGNEWTRTLFDGDFYRGRGGLGDLPDMNLVFVQSWDGNTVADNPSTLGGGDTDKHLIYEGLSRVDADAVLAGAATARSERMVFSIWHPELVELRCSRGHRRHPAQVVVTDRGNVPIERGLMFEEPTLPVYLITKSPVVAGLRARLRDRPWVEVVDAGESRLAAGRDALPARTWHTRHFGDRRPPHRDRAAPRRFDQRHLPDDVADRGGCAEHAVLRGPAVEPVAQMLLKGGRNGRLREVRTFGG